MLKTLRTYSASTLSLAIIIGAATPFHIYVSTQAIYLSLIIVLSLAFVLFFYKPKQTGVFVVGIVVLIGLTIGTIRGEGVHQSERYELARYYDQKITLSGTVSEYPDERIAYTYLTLSNIKLASSTKKINESVLVRAPLYPRYVYGDTIKVSGKIQAPKEIGSTTTVSRFSYPKYLSVNNIYGTITYPQIISVAPAQKSFIGTLYNFKDRCIKIVTSYIPEPSAGLLVGILFGIKKALSDEVLQTFITAGVVHIIVLSGYNIAVVVEGISKATSRMPRRTRYIISHIAIYIFVLFVGASSTALRAGIMASIALFAKQTGRSSNAVQLLFVAAAALALYEPRMILYDTSFQLSFLATLGLILYTPFVARAFKKITNKLGLREIVASTIATQITVLPFLLYIMGKVSIIGVFANIIIVPIVPIVMLLGAVTIALGLVYLPIAAPTSFLCFAALAAIIYIAKVFAAIPFASIAISISLTVLLVIYTVQILFILFNVSSITE